MKHPKYLSDLPKPDQKGCIVRVSITRDGKTAFTYEGLVIETHHKSPRVLVMPVHANQFSVPKLVEAAKLEVLEYGN